MNFWSRFKRAIGLEVVEIIDINGCFSQDWETLDPLPGFVRNQRPNKWEISFVDPGNKLYDSEDKAEGYPEAVHKLNSQLPERERLGGSDALILCHDEATAAHEPAVYKIFNSGAAFGATLSTFITGLEPGTEATISVPIRCHRHGRDDYDPDADTYATEFRMETNGVGGWWNGEKLLNRQWRTRTQRRTIEDDGILEIVLQVKSKYNTGVDFFFDNITVEAVVGTSEPVPSDPPEEHGHPEIEEALDDLYDAQNELHELWASLDNRIRVLEDLHGDPAPPPSSSPGDLIIDVSYWNGTVDWEYLKDKIDGVFVRSSNGLGNFTSTPNGVDGQFWRNVSECSRLGIPFGVYHFLNGADDVPMQMDHWMSILRDMLDAGYIPTKGIAYDAEESSPTVEVALEVVTTTAQIYEAMPEMMADDTYVMKQANNYLLEFVPESSPQGLRRAAELMVQNNPTDNRCGIYTRKSWWDGIVPASATWPVDLDLFLWQALWVSNQPLTSWPGPNRTITPANGFDSVLYWQFSSQIGGLLGLSTNSMDGSYVMKEDRPEPPPPEEEVDILSYMIGTHKRQYDLEYDYSGGGTQTIQTITEPDGFFKYIKGNRGQYERLSFDDNYIYRYEDTSESEDRFYIQTTDEKDKMGSIGAVWIARFLPIGGSTATTKYIQHYNQEKCTEANGGWVTDTIQLVAHYNAYQFRSGVVLDDVIELRWLEGGESYLYAKGYGLVGFFFSGGESWFMSGPLQGREDLPVDIPSCLS